MGCYMLVHNRSSSFDKTQNFILRFSAIE